MQPGSNTSDPTLGPLHLQVDRFYQKVIADPTVSPYFSATDMQKQRAKQTAFLAYALVGGMLMGVFQFAANLCYGALCFNSV